MSLRVRGLRALRWAAEARWDRRPRPRSVTDTTKKRTRQAFHEQTAQMLKWRGLLIMKAEHLWLKHPVIAQELYRPITLLGTNTAINYIIIRAIGCMCAASKLGRSLR